MEVKYYATDNDAYKHPLGSVGCMQQIFLERNESCLAKT